MASWQRCVESLDTPFRASFRAAVGYQNCYSRFWRLECGEYQEKEIVWFWLLFIQSTVTEWIEQLKDGRESAATKLWDHFLEKLTTLVRKKLRSCSTTIADEEDVVLDAVDACFRALSENRYPKVKNRDDLWKLLAVIAERKAIDQIRRSKKGVDGIRANVSFRKVSGTSSIIDGIQEWPCSEPTPEFAAIVAENLRVYLDVLQEPYRQVALLKMQGYSNREIGEKIERSIPTVERYLKLIRTIWTDESNESTNSSGTD